MAESINTTKTITRGLLQQASYQLDSPFQLHFNNHIIECQHLLRIVPGKRLVFSGVFDNKKVIIKLFVHESRAQKHWSREEAGAKLLLNNHIDTPEIIAQGKSDEDILFLIFLYIEGQDLARFWKQSNYGAKVKKLESMMNVLSQHHQAGLAHQDLHYANFFIDQKNNVYTLDGEEVKSGSKPLSKTLRLKNLALFLAQTFDLSKSTNLHLLHAYAGVSDVSLQPQDSELFWAWIKEVHQARIKQYLKKILRECTEVVYDKTSVGYTLCRREQYTSEIQSLLQQPEHFFQAETSTFLKQGNTCTVKSVEVSGERYVIKRYNPKGVMYELTHKGQSSRARISWINSHLLRFMGILTPEPVALIEHKNSLGKRCSYFITRQVEGKSSWDYFCEQSINDNSRHIADELINTLSHLCQNDITHGDLKGSNFLINNDQVYVLDLDGLKQHKNKRKFDKAWKKDKQRFLKNWDKKECYEPWKSYFKKKFQAEFSDTNIQ